jgi:hypothetical protein
MKKKLQLILLTLFILIFIKNSILGRVPGAHGCNPSYTGGSRLKASPKGNSSGVGGNSLRDPISKNPSQK